MTHKVARKLRTALRYNGGVTKSLLKEAADLIDKQHAALDVIQGAMRGLRESTVCSSGIQHDARSAIQSSGH